MSTQIYPEAGNELAKQGRERLMKAAKEAQLAESGAQRSRRSFRSMAYAVLLVLVAGLAFATIVFASTGGGGGGGGTYLVM